MLEATRIDRITRLAPYRSGARLAETAELRYQTGFANELASEALPGALPEGQTSPQRPTYGLYTEGLTGTSFTSPRQESRRTWVYRIQPSTVSGPFVKTDSGLIRTAPLALGWSPNPQRWAPFPIPDTPADFVQGLITLAANGDPATRLGMAVHIYLANRSMTDRAFANLDGEMLIVPQQGSLLVTTELGILAVRPTEILVIPKGLRFKVELPDGPSRGYVCENYGAPFRLPELGPIGSHGLANIRDFLAPVAAFEEPDRPYEIIGKAGGSLWAAQTNHSPFDVVAWQGNSVPCKYDLSRFMTVSSVSFDHTDPSIYTVLTAPSDTPGTANVDFVAFTPRWMVSEHTFRPPYFHRNVMSEFMGLIEGRHEAKADGFLAGGASLHNSGVAHGPDAATTKLAMAADLVPQKFDHSYAFMFETSYPLRLTEYALNSQQLQQDYAQCWQGIESLFTGKP
ncbi:homogentisate 1,2-dioxygenase [Pigmentiphaga sp. NML030171]|uniref:homogentisate 1,2-dioxygenase n=1 Tax=Pigmentiphaga sp. NML030171 TaxID=2008676 RepID=UPI000B419F3C|nr:MULTISPECIES: homogentisate 1,2-dioxygenase [unclassified Pigmentiphaga]OVZ66435.1 homogentisate 1,2-dioxygenase [Pigmentiphaga sp. NML030171]